MKQSILISLFLISLITSLSAHSSADKNAKAFGHLPMFQNAKVSPNGKKVVSVYNSPQGPQIVISDFGSKDIATIVKLQKSRDRIDEVQWANNKRLLIKASYSKPYFGDRIRISRLFAVNIDGTELVELKSRSNHKAKGLSDVFSSKRILSLLKDDPDHIIVEAYDGRDEAYAAFKVNVYSKDFEKLFINKYDVSRWSANEDGDVILGVEYDSINDGQTHIWYRKDTKTEWKLIHTQQAFQDDVFEPVVVAGDKLYVISTHEYNRQGLWLYDIPTGEFEKLIYIHDKYDVAGVITEPGAAKVIGVRYMDDYIRTVFFSESDDNVLNIVQQSFPGYETFIASMDSARKKVLVSAQNNTSPDKYFWVDLEKKSGGLWFSQYPYLEGVKLPATEKFSFEASDGMTLHGYITQPHGSKPEEAPLVVLPHGGPFGVRDYQYFDPYVQYMTSLGYAVMQVNFRGSGGFGSAYEAKGYRKWGTRMQQDVYDAIDYIAEKQLANTKNSCLVGASYGGYVALTAAFQRPEQFKCIVSIAGIADLVDLAEDEYKYGGSLRQFIIKTVGNPKDKETRESLESLSAVNQIEKIKAPILLIHGTNDTQVNFSQSSDFYSEAKKAGVDVEYIKIKDGTHYLDDGDNRQLAFKAFGEFLEKHLKK